MPIINKYLLTTTYTRIQVVFPNIQMENNST